MEISQLITLVHVAELGSVSKAADRLNIVQPALSRQIRMLEDELGAPLFDRHGRGMTITAIGQEVLDHALRVLSELDAMRRTVEDGRSSYRGLVRVGTPPTISDFLTVPLIKRIRADHPELGIRLSSAFSGYLLDWLGRGELDIVVSYDPPSTKSLRIEPVLMEKLFLIVPAGSMPANRPVPFTELAEKELILPSPNHGLRRIFDDCARTAGITFRSIIEADSFAAIVDLTCAGLGATILPAAPVHKHLESGQLIAIPLVEPEPERRLVICYSADRPVNSAARYVGEQLIRLAADRVQCGVWQGTLLQ